MAGLTIELPSHEEQTVLNLQRWSELLTDAELARWQGRVETDRHGHILMSPPASSEHGGFEAEICYRLRHLKSEGKVYGECPVSTADGVKVADAAWISAEKLAKIGRRACLSHAPEICVKILSPTNSRREMAEKKALYFSAGAVEVWLCDAQGRMTFFAGPESDGKAASRLCPEFPESVVT